MAKAKRRAPGWAGVAIAFLVVALFAAVARAMGASLQQIVWGTLACLACALLTEFVAWLTTGGPLRLEKRPAAEADRRTDQPE